MTKIYLIMHSDRDYEPFYPREAFLDREHAEARRRELDVLPDEEFENNTYIISEVPISTWRPPVSPYKGNFGSWRDVVYQFCGGEPGSYSCKNDWDEYNKHLIEPTEVVLAKYGIDGYDGGAWVLFRRGKTWYMLQGSHCSCHGLEEAGFDPEVFKNVTEVKAYLTKIRDCGGYIYGVDDDEFDAVLERFKISPKVKQ